ncbi:hypothetical protein ACQP1O_13240 [Nocardia sp. CA-151230]|uniref:hypothetical protein n=1 Tax=Nocardia sp. CA-151230 TaxID=3239982 RepID=UPI003D8C3A4A
MSSKMIKFVAAIAIALPLGVVAAPAASAATPSSTSTAVIPADGSIAICFPLGSVVWCI